MPIFSYVTKDIQGIYHNGEVETTDEFQAARLLRRKKLIVISLKVKNESMNNPLDKFLSRVSFADVVIITRQLATMIEAGLVLSEALDILEEQQSNKFLKKVLSKISSDVKGGLDFASALEKHPGVFPSLYSKLVRAGQASGKLDTILLELANNLEKEREFRSKVRGAMIYPVVIIFMMIAVMSVMVFFVMPKLMSLYSDSGVELPLLTRIMIGFASFATSYWWAVIAGVVGVVLLVQHYISTSEGKLLFDQLVLKIPVIGKIISLVILTDFTRTFSLLVSSGLPILDSIKIVGDISGNRVYKDSLDTAYRGVERGLTLSSQLLGLPIFPKILGQMVKTGEETGKLDEVIGRLASYFESEADNSLKNITTLIEPLVLVILGVGVGFLVVSIIMPIYQLTTTIK